MKTRGKKVLAMLLTVCMVFSLLPAGALAQDEIVPVSPDSFVQEVELDAPLALEDVATEEDLAVEPQAVTDLFISEYIEGSGTNKAIEIYNGTSESVDLSGYSLAAYSNGSATQSTPVALTGTLPSGKVAVAVNSGNGAILKDAITASGCLSIVSTAVNFNGNDPIALIKGSTIIDIIGTPGAGAADFAKDVTLVRKSSVTAGATTYDATEWETKDKDDFTFIGFYGEPAPATQVATPVAAPVAGGVVAGTQVTLTCATVGAKIYYTVDGSAPTASSTEYIAPITIDVAKTIKAIGVDPKVETPLDSSEVLTAAYTILSKQDIGDVRKLAEKVPAAVEGTVIADYNGEGMKALGCYIQDATGGIMLFDSTGVLPTDIKVGDTLKVTGTTAVSSGKQEIVGLTATKIGTAAVTPATITVADINTDAKAEAKEGTLVTLNALTVTAKATDSYGTCTLTLTNGGASFSAKLDNRRPSFTKGELENKLNIGDVVTVVGYIESLYNDQDHILQLRSKDDVTVTTPCTVVQPPVPAKASGAAVDLNEKIPVTCVTPGATIEFNTTPAEAVEGWTTVPVGGLVMPNARGEYTVYIRAVKADFTTSDVVTLKYVVGMAAMTSILEARKQAKDEEVFIKGIIIGDAGSAGFYIQDATGGVCIAAKLADIKKITGLENLAVGQEISIRAKVIDAKNGLFQIAPLTVPGDAPETVKIDPDAIKITNATPIAPTPIPVTPAMLNTGYYEGRLVKLSKVVLTKAVNAGSPVNFGNHTLGYGGVETVYRAEVTAADGAILDVVGVASTFNSAQLLPAIPKPADNGVTVTAADGSTVGDPIAESAVWSAPSMGDKDPIPAKWPAVDGVNKTGAELTAGGGAALAKTTGQGYAATKWNSGVGTKYWQIKFSTEGMSDVTVSSYHRSSGTGPSAFQTQYSVDGSNFFNVAGGDIALVYDAGNNDGRHTVNKLPLPTDANDKATVYVRWVLSSNQQLKDPAKDLDAGGANQVNNIIVAGNEYYGPDDVAPVKTDPVAGAVPAGTTVTLRTATAGTTIRYTTDGITDPTAAVGTEGTSVTLTTLPMTIKAVAYKTDTPTKICPVKTFTFTQAQVRQPGCNKLSGSKIIVGLDQITFTVQKGAVVKYMLNGGTEQTYNPAAPIALLDTDFIVANEGKATIVARATMENYTDSVPITLSFVKSEGGAPKNYFGQLHSHTAENSDGSGTLEEAFSYAANKSGVDFLAVTDHSNAFDDANKADGPETYNLTTYNADNAKWAKGLSMAEKYTSDKFVGMYGYEMTWSGGPGHVNTFATTGFVSRNNAILNSKTNDKGMRAYYELLSRPDSAASITQFNHPGDTFGNFSNFGYYDPVIDSRITLVEVGNGEGAIGSGGYFPSYSEYTLALDKGWHIAPTNNQDNHKQMWGNANNARTVAYTNDLTREGIYQAMRDMRVYATEDKNLDIVYTINGAVMGTILNVVPATANFKVVINDPDALERISTVSIVSVGGKIVHKVEDINRQNYTLEHTITPPEPGYYYIRVQQTDKDIAVTAPIWLGAAPAVGMSELTTDTFMVVKDEAMDLSLNLFNNEDEDVTLKTLTYAIKGGSEIEAKTGGTIPAASTQEHTHSYTPTTVGKQTIVATAVITVGSTDRTYTSELEIDVKDPANLIYVGVDGSHYNEYVAGNYKDGMGNFGKLAGGYDVRVNVLKTSAELIAAMSNPKYAMMVFTAPTRRLENITYASYSDAELAAVAAFAAQGGTAVVAGWGDFYESYAYSPKEPEMQMAAQQNKLLSALGATLRLADDEAKDNTNNPGSNAARLYLTDYNSFKDPLLAGVNPAQVWSQYGGCTVFAVDGEGKASNTLPASVTPIISGYGAINSDGTGKLLNAINSEDDDKDGYGAEMEQGARPPKYTSDKGTTSLLVASETVTREGGKSSLVVVSGGAFMSNFEIKADVENASSLNYSNYNLLENLVETLNPPTITKVEDVVKETVVGTPYIIEGTVMSTIWNGTDTNTGFFDCIYVQDETGGINVFPVASGVVPGQKVRITGTYNAYEGERQLQDAKVKVLTYNPGQVPDAKVITTKEAAENTYLGMLVKVTGKVESIKQSNGVVESIMLKDDSGVACRVFIDGYITKGKSISGLSVGSTFTATGFSSINTTHAIDDPDNRIRVRDRADVYDPTYVPPSGGGGTTTKPVEPNPEAPPVAVKPDVSVSTDGSSANSSVSNADLNNAVKEAGKSGSTSIVIDATPAKDGDKVTTATVKLPQSALATAGKNTNLSITVNTSVAGVTLPNAAVVALGKENNVAISAVKGENGTVTVSVTAGDKTLDTVKGGLVATLPVEKPAPGLVAVLVKADGTEEIIPKSALTGAGVAALLDGSATLVLKDNSKTFADTTSHWAKDSIAATSARELFQGVSATEFAPDAKTSRGMVVTVLHRLERESAAAGKAPGDVSAGSYYANASAWALEQKITTGDGNGNFAGDRDVTVGELATMVYRYAQAMGLDTSARAELTGFKDADAVAPWASDAFAWGVATGIFTGTDAKNLNPGSTATRAQLSVVCQRIVELFLA